MNSSTPTSNGELLTCERCGSVLVIFEEHEDGAVIYCACPCRADGTAAAKPLGNPKKLGDREAGPAAAPETQAIEPSSGGRSFVMVGAVVLVIAAAVAGLLLQGRGRTSTSGESAGALAPPSFRPSVEFQTDESGAVTLASGADPDEVLRGLCRHPRYRRVLVPGNLQPASPPDPGLLIGSALPMDGTGILRQLVLRRDPTTKRWSIGDGKNPIAFAIAPADPARTGGSSESN